MLLDIQAAEDLLALTKSGAAIRISNEMTLKQIGIRTHSCFRLFFLSTFKNIYLHFFKQRSFFELVLPLLIFKPFSCLLKLPSIKVSLAAEFPPDCTRNDPRLLQRQDSLECPHSSRQNCLERSQIKTVI